MTHTQTGWKAYLDATIATAIYPDVGHNFPYTALGLCGETSEVLAWTAKEGAPRDDLLAELGDVCWYVAAASREAGIDATVLDDAETGAADGQDQPGDMWTQLVIATGTVAEQAKKAV
jgi:NTP pyrophosphatase (non-canonical NTP hydrolase)